MTDPARKRIAPRAAQPRIVSLDQLRGMIMVLMALDHASFFIARMHSREFWGTPLPVYETVLPFLLRGVTHICAPGFFVLMGVGMAMLAASRGAAGWSPGSIRRFFLWRGLILIGIQVLVENPAWALAFVRAVPGTFVSRGGPIPGHGDGMAIYLGVLFALGAAMVFWSLAGGWRTSWVATVSVAALFVTQLLTPGPEAFSTDYPVWVRMLQIPGRSGPVVVFYPVIPWLGLAGLGLVLGRHWCAGPAPQPRQALTAAAILLAVFVVIRLGGEFGNFHTPGNDWIGVLNVTKYPPSLAFMALTLGINALLWGVLGTHAGQHLNWLAVFGRTPLLFYILHLYLFGFLGWSVPAGVSQTWMLLFWLAGLAILYPLCRWYARFKTRTPADSIWRFL